MGRAVTVSREALAQPDCAKRRYVSPARTSRGERTRVALIEAVLSFVAVGNFRPSGREIGERAGVHLSNVNRHFGSIELLYRVIAREHAEAVVQAAEGQGVSLPYDHSAIAWLIMIGRPRELS